MSRTRFRCPRPRSRPQSGQRSNSCLSHNSETAEANLTKLHRKMKHNEKMCHAQDLGSYAQGHIRVRGHIRVSAEANLMKLLRKIKHNEKVCHAHDLGSYAQSHSHNRVRGQIRVSAITQKLLKQI